MKNTKLCPHCGQEILEVAKKCRYCHNWIEENPIGSDDSVDGVHDTKDSAQNNINDDNEVDNEEVDLFEGPLTTEQKNTLILLLLIAVIVIVYCLTKDCSSVDYSKTYHLETIEEPHSPQNENESITYSYDNSDMLVIEEDELEPIVDLSESRYNAKYDEVNIADIHLVYADGKKIWYTPYTSTTSSGYLNKLFVYDSELDREKVINLNKTSIEDDYMQIDDAVVRNGVITLIMTENTNSNGWVIGTYVWQYDCKNGTWKAIAKNCSGAEFVNEGTAVRYNNAECINPNDPTYMQEYRNNYKVVPL